MASLPPKIGARQAWVVWTSTLISLLAIGAIDYATGVELRVYPLYYAPITLVAWYYGRWTVLATAAVCSLLWFLSNVQAGMNFAHPAIWVANTLVQGVSFATVGLLIRMLRASLGRERSLSRTDPLTLLLNTRAFYEEGNRMLALCRRHGRPVTLAYFDVDNFKNVNDAQGHQAGDDLLKRVAELIRGTVRLTDLSARLGGDEFAVLLPEVDAAEAGISLERLRSTLADAFAGDAMPVTVSVGAVTFAVAPDHIEPLVQQADAAMYQAKNGGRNRVRHEVASSPAARVAQAR